MSKELTNEQKLDRILEMVTGIAIDQRKLNAAVQAAIPKSRHTRTLKQTLSETATPKDLAKRRVAQLMTIFGTQAELPRAKKKKQGYNSAIVGVGLNGAFDADGNELPPKEIVPKSVLLNRCQQYKVFKPVKEFGEETINEVLGTVLDNAVYDGLLVVTTIADLEELNCESTVEVVCSTDEYKRINGEVEDKPKVKPKVKIDLKRK